MQGQFGIMVKLDAGAQINPERVEVPQKSQQPEINPDQGSPQGLTFLQVNIYIYIYYVLSMHSVYIYI